METDSTTQVPGRVIRSILATVLFFAALEGLIFHTSLYPSIIDPDSTAGSLEKFLRNERLRPKHDRNQVLAVGDSRMALVPRVANEMNPSTGYTFARVSLGGALPRVWYYQLRYVDPAANQYAAILIPSDDYDEPDRPGAFYADHEADLHYLVARLTPSDLCDFPWSYHENRLRWTAFRAMLLKGSVYKRDFLEFLADPSARIANVALANKYSWLWAYNFDGLTSSLAGLEVDWAQKSIHYPEGVTQETRDQLKDVFFPQEAAQSGLQTAYFQYWHGRIVDHYRGSGTKIFFLRVPRAPVSPPGHPSNPASSIRRLASHRNVVVLDEHLFDVLERPEYFMDPYHLNRTGLQQFTRILALEVRRVLGPPKP